MDLRRSHSLAKRILDSLAADRDVPRILKGLRAQEDLASIARLLESSPTSEPQAKLVDSPLTEEPADGPYGSLASASIEGSQPSYSGGSQQRPDSVANPSTRTNQSRLGPWRTPLVNELLIKHLISLYWVWIHPAHPILNMARFFKDYETRGSRHCSAYLINAICAAACDLLNPEWENVPGKKTDVVALRQHLIAEAAIQAALADPEASTTADASAVISIINNRNVRAATPGF
ncbi:MAG: hypothetical protein LQ347_002591 [Umbilicaria vellea]|nr:MAG: hypothetical protein LQ347_002591 [Umbilicaria vellea]